MNTDFDIAICGAGPVGMTLAGLLSRRGMKPERIALIDAKSLDQSRQDPRSIALSFGSKEILEQVGAWPVPATAIHQIHVSRRRHFGRTLIEREDYGLPALGYVTRYGSLVSSLAGELEGKCTVFRPMQIVSTLEDDAHVALQFADGSVVKANIAVQAEGGVFGSQSAKSIQRNYDQVAIVAHVIADNALSYRAFERFTDEGPLALLPQEDGYALVWCVRPATAERLLRLADEDFLRQLQQAFGDRVGRFTGAGPRASFPLGLNARPAPTARTTAIGNAAQTLHPVAGQGLNLGMRDASVLAQVLAVEASPDALLRFAAMRHSDRSLTMQLTDIMARIFASAPDGTKSQSFLSASLGLIDAFGPAKKLLADHMLFGRR
ncbi:MAG: FAD-dependent monooxygenase [Burkholderiaceae bacterium]